MKAPNLVGPRGASHWRDALLARTATPLSRFHAGLRYYFDIGKPGDYLCEVMLRCKLVQLDVLKFDELLHARHGEYDADGINCSAYNLVRREYGDEAAVFVRHYIGDHQRLSDDDPP
jgi:hypothetical protein